MLMDSPAASPPVGEVLDELAATDAVRRLFDRDVTLWGGDAEAQALAAERLGWLDSGRPAAGWPDRLRRFATSSRDRGIGRAVLCGMGGSAFAPGVLANVIDPGGAGARLTLLDSTHPVAVRSALGGGLEDAMVVVASKSGTTIETRAMQDYAATCVPGPGHLVAVTDPGTPLEYEAGHGSWSEVFLNPPDIGGRFSGLSLFGMVPAALAGLPVEELWARADAAARRCSPDTAPESNPAARIAAFAVAHARAGRDKLTLLLDPRLASFGLWVEQMVAESTGKHGKGIVPVIGEPAATAVDGRDRAFVEVRLGGRPVEGAASLADAGRPIIVTNVEEPLDVAGALFEWMAATALAGALLGINPFDQPDVGSAKDATAGVLGEITGGASLPEPEDGDITAVRGMARRGDYVAIAAYLPPGDEAWRGLRDLQEALGQATGCAVTANFGPRYLHSTGQLHKGGPNTCVVVHVLDDPEDEPIPGRSYGFATLLRAQAVGDLRALRSRDRRCFQVRAGVSELPGLAQRVRATSA
jgi:glucose-6-phosphate isomerase